MELSVGDRITERGDGNYLRTDLTIGANFDDGRGNAVLSVGYQESDPAFQGGDRPWSNLALDSSSPSNLGLSGSSTTTPSRFDTSIGNLQVSPDGQSLVPYYLPFNFNPYNVFQTPFTRYNLFSSGHYDITDHLTVYARGLFSQNTVKTIIAPSGVFASTVTIPISNPFLTPAMQQTFCTIGGFDAATCAAAAAATDPTDPAFRTVDVGLRRRTTEVGPRISNFKTSTWDFRAGIRGDITDKIGFDVFGSRGITSSVQHVSGYTLLSRVRDALLATNPDTCLSGNDGCVPLNVFGQPGTITPEMVDYITDASSISTDVKLSQARATINGDTPLQLWAKNPVSFAVGTEYRKYTSEITPDSLAQSGDLGGFGGAPPHVKGGLDVYEGFAEVIAPIISDRPFFDELQLEAGIRRSHYTVDASPSDLSAAGLSANPKFNTTTWKVAGSWAPIHDIKFRGAYNHAVRAPNISELFTPLTTVLTNLAVDPCAGAQTPAQVTPTNPLNPNLANPDFAAICLAQGAPAGRIGFIENPTAGQANLTTGGSLTLKPEIANTWTVGAVIRPRFVPGLSATVDYYHIKVKKAITIPTPDDIIAACFGSVTASSATNPACTNIRRNAISGALDGDPLEVPRARLEVTDAGTDFGRTPMVSISTSIIVGTSGRSSTLLPSWRSTSPATGPTARSSRPWRVCRRTASASASTARTAASRAVS
jgi:outer membrane receptor protein involved in Fe transport